MAELPHPRDQDKRGWSNNVLAEQSGVSVETVKRFLNGSVEESSAHKILAALDLDYAQVMEASAADPAEAGDQDVQGIASESDSSAEITIAFTDLVDSTRLQSVLHGREPENPDTCYLREVQNPRF
ncbi:hypothetical protein DO97_21490 [Neosynechococcus sphagnicola sy1]|uniref:Uncharacterized protein n=1 Tax=Neosynechococcus sphagnicola sy1 TaxID=1497020 RepID=A0A098THD5_9CYAN|nr:LacI family DNA-binding transcriptional regulator [Neosynechococcus sphagnicola]KGF71387.1 hypothetical protein DO97_21490 [Neosynechococcus sphagnicola sy1]